MAAYPYVRLVQFGTINTVQDWSVGLGVTIALDLDPTNLQLSAWLGDISPAAQTWWTASGGGADQNTADVIYTGIRAYSYLAGATAAKAQAELIFGTPRPGRASSAQLPDRTCLVMSLKTGLPGRSFRGRRYLPCTNAGLSHGQLSSTVIANALAPEVAFLNAVNDSTIGSRAVTACIINNRDFAQPITQVSVNSLPDTQRRRTDKITPESTITSDLT